LDALAVGVVAAALLLVSLNQLRFTDGLAQGASTVLVLAIPLSLGSSVAREVFSGRTSRTADPDEDGDESSSSVLLEVLNDVGATAVGGVFIGLSIAVTDEIPMISAGLTWWHLFLIMGISLLLSYIIVFASG